MLVIPLEIHPQYVILIVIKISLRLFCPTYDYHLEGLKNLAIYFTGLGVGAGYVLQKYI